MWQTMSLPMAIGSLPYRSPEPALTLIGRETPLIPHWPQLPLRGAQEGFVLQNLNLLMEVGVLERDGEKVVFATEAEDWPDRLAAFYMIYLAVEEGDEKALDQFAMPEESATGFYAFLEAMKTGTGDAVCLKGQVVGPLTAGFQLTDRAGRPAYYDDQIRDVIVKNLAMTARWQARVLAQFGLKTLIFIDEPGISIFGQSTYITVTRQMIIDDMNAVVDGIRAGGADSGIHSCAAVDWSILFESHTGVVSFDAYDYFDSMLPYRSELSRFLDRGGVVAWGIVPTSEAARAETPETLAARLNAGWAQLTERGLNRANLQNQALITPACGTGTLPEDLAEHIYRLTTGVSRTLRAE
ncbi:MAG: hypothetical protein U1D96_09775 [Eubacteriales bacterium]|jgi:hypothetical protein|nr:hypothetical protein [Bacillota bacterium]MBV1726989.1 hypothetical protein [Desulforudis sp.]MDQ7789462.1 hypothetical protein [Clostridia bacterium]MDZ4043754.1 hypothetical protein [Eubacteriales bacterium]MBU4534033.1 hypothetical protein [Bacillota bacterium]